MEQFNILIVEDDFAALQVLKRVLEKENYITIPVDNVEDAFSILKREKIDLIVSDWMMPNIDGIEFLFRLKANFSDPPPVIIVTALTSDMAKEYALRSGAAEFIEKPINIPSFIQSIKKILETQKSKNLGFVQTSTSFPPFIPIAFLSGNGGVNPLLEILTSLKNIKEKIVYTIIQQGNKFLVDSLITKIKEKCSKEAIIPQNLIYPKENNVYIAPHDYHLSFTQNYELLIDKGPKENYQRPSAEPLFRTMANYFGNFSIVVILSGLGADGIQGAMKIKSNGGHIICQEPSSAIAPTLPQSYINSSIEPIVLIPEKIPKEIEKIVNELSCIKMKKQ
ncbi:MAG: response regulator [Ignavibacteria bacterium]|nr:response regulator [Ignavibacteria bacterium]